MDQIIRQTSLNSHKIFNFDAQNIREVAEWLKAHAWKACIR